MRSRWIVVLWNVLLEGLYRVGALDRSVQVRVAHEKSKSARAAADGGEFLPGESYYFYSCYFLLWSYFTFDAGHELRLGHSTWMWSAVIATRSTRCKGTSERIGIG